FEMYLTRLIFQAGLTVFLVALVIIFQEELRRAFERFASVGPFGRARARPPLAEKARDALADTVFALAARKTGALLVVQGREPLTRHVHGGVALYGEISAPLLFSLFDPGSPGH